MPSIRVDERKPFNISLRNFKRACEKAGIKQELREIDSIMLSQLKKEK